MRTGPLRRSGMLFGLLLLLTAQPHSADRPFPLEPPDTSSPQATLLAFMRNNSEGVTAYRRNAAVAAILSRFERAERCLDLSEVSPDRARSVATEASLLIYEVLNRAGLPEIGSIPDAAEVERRGLESWSVPYTDIRIHRVEEGPRAGEFLFSPSTIARALRDYQRVKHLAHRTEFAPGNYEDYVTRPALGMPAGWADGLPAWAKARVLRNPVWKWAAILAGILAGLGLALAAYRLTAAWDARFPGHAARLRVGKPVLAVSLMLIPLGVRQVFEDVVGVRFDVHAVLSKGLLVLAFSAAVFAVFALFELFADVLISSRRLRKRSLDAHLIKVTTRTLGLVVAVAVVLQAADFLGWPFGPVLAGLGLGGLAIALAARPTLENIIGGFILFADRPVRVGDYCEFGGDEGTVEEIGLRSTRIRKRDDTVVTIPNADFSSMQVQNNARRRRWLYRTTLGLRYETTPDQLRFVLAKLREMLLRHPKVAPEPLVVRFLGFGDFSLDIELLAYIRTRDWLVFRALREDVNLRIMDIVKESGTGFAFPSRTAYMARDAGLDGEKGLAAEAEVETWRTQGRLPFPDLGEAAQARLLDTLDYPPTGSPAHAAKAGSAATAASPGTGEPPVAR